MARVMTWINSGPHGVEERDCLARDRPTHTHFDTLAEARAEWENGDEIQLEAVTMGGKMVVKCGTIFHNRG